MSAAHEPEARVPVYLELLKVFDGCGEPLIGDRARDPPLAQHRDGLDVRQIGLGDVSGVAELQAGSLPVVPVIADDIGKDGRASPFRYPMYPARTRGSAVIRLNRMCIMTKPADPVR